MTNGDRMRAMSNKELAKVLYCGIPSICKICKGAPEDDVIKPILEFLDGEYIPGSVDGGEENDKR